MRSVAVWPDYGAGPSATVSSQVFDLDDAGDDAGYAPDRTLTLTSIVAFLFLLWWGLAVLIIVAAGPVLDLAMPPSLLFLFGLTGLLGSATAALAMRQTALRMADLVIDVEAAPRGLLLHAMTDRLPEGIASWDKDDRLVLCNQAYREFFSCINGILRAGVHFDDALNADLDTAYILAAAAPSWFEQRQQRHWIGDFSERRKIEGREYGVLDRLCAGDSRIFDFEYRVLHGNSEQRWISDRALAWRGLGPVRA